MLYRLFNAPRLYPRAYEKDYDAFDFYNGRDRWVQSTSTIPERAVDLFCVHWLHLEVHNGGFSQYFYNSTGVTAPEAAKGYAAIGMAEVAAVVHQAMALLGTPFPFDREDRMRAVDRLEDQVFEGPTDAYYALADTEAFFRRKPKFVEFADRYAMDSGLL